MAPEIQRIVDAHIHLWDPANTEWYPYLTGLRDVGMGDLSGWARYFDQKIYLSESANWNVQKMVHVAAASDFVGETLAREAEAQDTGHPDAIVGGVALVDVAEAEEQLDRQMAASRFRGVRPMGGNMERPVPVPGILRALQERNLVFDLMAHPDQLQEAARDLEGWSELTVVIEHTGWPHADTDEEFELWRKGMAALASLGPNVHCKALRPLHAVPDDEQRRVQTVDRLRARRVRGRPVRLRLELPPRQHSRDLRPALLDLFRDHLRPRRRGPGEALRGQRRARLPLLTATGLEPDLRPGRGRPGEWLATQTPCSPSVH